MRQSFGLVLDQGVKLETDISVISMGLFPHWQENCLRGFHKFVVECPGNLFVIQPTLDQLDDLLIELPSLDDVGDDGRVRRGPSDSPKSICFHLAWFYAVEPYLSACADQ